jgi:hypothetical protein
MSWFTKALGIGGPTPEQQKKLILQMNTLNDYVMQNDIPFVPDDPNHPFVKCTNFAIEKKNGDEKTEYFLNLKDGFVSLSTGNFLKFTSDCISNILRFYTDDSLNNFMNGYLFSRPGALTANVKTLYTVCAAAAAAAKQQNQPENEQVQKRRSESDYQYQLRMQRLRMEKEREQANLSLANPQNCLQNFAEYLNSPTREIGKEIKNYEPIYDLLVRSLDSTEGGFALGDYRPTNILSDYTPVEIDAMRIAARQQKQQFIDTLCKNGSAVKLMLLAKKRNDYPDGGQYAINQQNDVDEYRTNGWMALRGCLGLLEKFMSMQMPVQGAPMQGQGAPMLVQGGKSKSKSKSNRKKRNSHLRHSHKHHKHRTPKRR